MSDAKVNVAKHHRYLADEDEHEQYSPLGLEGLLATTEKVLAVNRGIAEPDNRDVLPNDRIHTVNRLLAERIKLDSGRPLRTLMGRLNRAKNLNPMAPDAFSDYTIGYLKANTLAPALEEVNPMHNADQQRRITKMGAGGIGDSNAVTQGLQAVHSSQFGFICPISGPECFDDKTEVFTRRGWVLWSEVLDDDIFACRVDGRLEWYPASRVVREHYKGEMIVAGNKCISMCVTPNHRVLFTDKVGIEKLGLAGELLGEDITLSYRRKGELRPPPDASYRIYSGDWSTVDYDGTVFCATVPGGVLRVRRETATAFWSGNSEMAGIDVRLAHGAHIGSDGKIYQVMRDSAGNRKWVSHTDVKGKVVRLPD